jgi:hypothetical protein
MSARSLLTMLESVWKIYVYSVKNALGKSAVYLVYTRRARYIKLYLNCGGILAVLLADVKRSSKNQRHYITNKKST